MPTASIEDAKKVIGKPLRWVKLGFTPIALVFLMVAGWHSRDILAAVYEQAITTYLILAILVWMFSHLLSPILSLIVFSTTNPIITYSIALSTHIGRLPARYLPGGIWHTVARLVDFHSYGVDPKQLTAYFILENTIALGVAFTVGGAIVSWYQETGIWHAIALFFSTGGLLGLAACPFIVNRWILDKEAALSIVAYIGAVGAAVMFWFFASTAFVVYLSAFPGSIQNSSTFEIAGTYLFSWGVGYVALFAPQGLGIFETVAGHVLHTPLSIGALAFLIAGFRVVVLMADLAVWSIMLLLGSSWRDTTRGLPRRNGRR